VADARRVAIVTGVSRRAGIGFEIARRLLGAGYDVAIQSWSEHDAAQPWRGEPGGIEATIGALAAPRGRLRHLELDLGDPAAPAAMVDAAVGAFGGVDALVVNHAHSSLGGLEQVSADELDRAWAVNARAAVLLVQAFARRHDDARGAGRVVLFTSGQHRAPMAGELAYAISKGAIQQMTSSLADALAERAIRSTRSTPAPTTPAGRKGSYTRRSAEGSHAGVGGRRRTSRRSSNGCCRTARAG
jgi:3-oxoacyl-[acyl-carrier protein] reductase